MSIYNFSLATTSIVSQTDNQYGTTFLLKQNFADKEACLSTPEQFAKTYVQNNYIQLLKAFPTLNKISFTVDSLEDFATTLPILQHNQQSNLHNLLICADRQHFHQLCQSSNTADILVYDLLALKVYPDLLPQLDNLLTEIVLQIKILKQHSLTVVLILDTQSISTETLFNLRSILSQLYEVCLYSSRFSIVLQYLLDEEITTQTWQNHIEKLINKMPLLPIEIINRRHICPTFKLPTPNANIVQLPDGSSISFSTANSNNVVFLPKPSVMPHHNIAFCPNDLLPQMIFN